MSYLSVWRWMVVLFIFMTASFAMLGQNAQAKTASTPTGPSSETAELDALLAKANSLYYSYARDGVTGFDCEVKPDWAQLFSSTTDSRIGLMNAVTIRLHVRTDGSTKMDWIDPPNPNDPNGVLGSMHPAMDQTLTGFVQFWKPFINSEVIPANSQGMVVHKSADGIVIHGEDKEVKLDEQLDNSLLLKHYDVTMTNQVVKFEPSYTLTGKGLIVTYFLAYIGPIDATPQQIKEMHVNIDYQDVQGVMVPQKVRFEVVGTGTVAATLSGCTVMKK